MLGKGWQRSVACELRTKSTKTHKTTHLDRMNGLTFAEMFFYKNNQLRSFENDCDWLQSTADGLRANCASAKKQHEEKQQNKPWNSANKTKTNQTYKYLGYAKCHDTYLLSCMFECWQSRMNEDEKSHEPSAAKFPKIDTFHTPETAKRKKTNPSIETYNQSLSFNIFSPKISNELS